jgi:hypothetical protein
VTEALQTNHLHGYVEDLEENDLVDVKMSRLVVFLSRKLFDTTYTEQGLKVLLIFFP